MDGLSRRVVLRGGALGALAAGAAGRARPQTSAQLSATSATAATSAATSATARTASLAARPGRSLDFTQGWLFGGPYTTGAEQPGFDDSGFAAVTLPHTVTPLSWGDWDPSSWQKRLDLPQALRRGAGPRAAGAGSLPTSTAS